MAQIGSNYICVAVILIDFVLKKDENFYPQVFLKEYKYIEKDEKVIRCITDDLKFFSDNSSEDNCYKSF